MEQYNRKIEKRYLREERREIFSFLRKCSLVVLISLSGLFIPSDSRNYKSSPHYVNSTDYIARR